MPSKFTVRTPVPETDVPAVFSLTGRTSPYLPLYEDLKKVKGSAFLPVDVDSDKDGYAIAQSLRKMANKDGKALDTRRGRATNRLFFRLVAKPQETK